MVQKGPGQQSRWVTKAGCVPRTARSRNASPDGLGPGRPGGGVGGAEARARAVAVARGTMTTPSAVVVVGRRLVSTTATTVKPTTATTNTSAARRVQCSAGVGGVRTGGAGTGSYRTV